MIINCMQSHYKTLNIYLQADTWHTAQKNLTEQISTIFHVLQQLLNPRPDSGGGDTPLQVFFPAPGTLPQLPATLTMTGGYLMSAGEEDPAGAGDDTRLPPTADHRPRPGTPAPPLHHICTALRYGRRQPSGGPSTTSVSPRALVTMGHNCL